MYIIWYIDLCVVDMMLHINIWNENENFVVGIYIYIYIIYTSYSFISNTFKFIEYKLINLSLLYYHYVGYMF